jgi:Leucine rich repeat
MKTHLALFLLWTVLKASAMLRGMSEDDPVESGDDSVGGSDNVTKSLCPDLCVADGELCMLEECCCSRNGCSYAGTATIGYSLCNSKRPSSTGSVQLWGRSYSISTTKYIYRSWALPSLTGTIPTKVGLLTALNTLSLSDNKLTGKIPTEVGLLTNLEWLDLGWNEFTGTIPRTLGKLTKLEYLDLNRNQLTGRIPSSVCSIKTLERLAVDCDELTCNCGSKCECYDYDV